MLKIPWLSTTTPDGDCYDGSLWLVGTWLWCSPTSRRRSPLLSVKPNLRRCISCRKVAHKHDLWRVVRVHPSREVQLDEGMGRSAYLCPQESCLKAAQKKDKLGRALKVRLPEHIYRSLWQRLETPIPKVRTKA